MHGRTLSMVSSNGGDDIFASFADGDEDGLSFDDLDAEGRDGLGPLDDSLGASHGAGGANGAARKGKKLASTAEKKATHNAVERARRESLNTRFLVLADMLPGMNHVKRASKAAIVNKSIALIQDLQASEQKLTSENEALKAELAVLRQRVAAGPTPATPAAGAVPTPPAPFPGMHAFAMHGMPMIPGMPPMMHHHPAGMPVPPHPPSAPMSHEEAYRRASMEAAAAAAAAAAASAPPNMQMFQAGMQSYFGMPNLPLVDSPPSTSALVPAAVKAESTGAGSPNSIYSQTAAASHAVQNVNAHLASELFPHGLFDFGMTGGSPAPSWTNGNSPPSGIGMHYTTAAAAASAELNKPGSSSAASSGGGPPGLSLGQSSAASPAGSQSSASTSITTPANTFSPIPLPSQQLQQHHHQQHFDACSGSSASGTPPPPPSSVTANAMAAMAAFSENADPALLAAQFNPSELAKAQSELGAFIAYQQRMAGFAAAAAAAAATQQQQQAASYQNTAPQPTPSPTQSSFNLPTAQQQQQQQQAIQQGNANSTANANAAALAAQAAAMGTMPAAWQMMLAQHHQQAQLAHQQQQQQQQHNSQAAAAAAMAAAAAAAGFQGQF